MLFSTLGHWTTGVTVSQVIYVVLQLIVVWAMTLTTVIKSGVKAMRSLLEEAEIIASIGDAA